MPWEKTFDTEDALGKAMAAFWARGYEATSMQDLVDCMGVGRGSIYAAFGDKRRLFMRALALYDERHRRGWTERLSGLASPRRAILSAFDEVVAATLDGSRDGCLLINTGLEMSPHDAEVAAAVSMALGEMEAFFRVMVRRGQVAGEIAMDIDTDEAARGLLALLAGLRVLSRARPDEALLRAVSRQAEALLGSVGNMTEPETN
jgi:TetR/AcrR family transcriptional repressor of nem operon